MTGQGARGTILAVRICFQMTTSQMSSVTNSEATINAFVNAVRPAFGYVVAATAFSTCLFTLFITLLALSTKESRRRLVFRLNVVAICLALTTSALIGLMTGEAVVNPFNQVSKSVSVAAVTFLSCSPLLYDSMLLTRLFAVYPIGSTPAVTLVKIFAFPFCVKCVRVAAITMGVRGFAVLGTTTEALIQNQSTNWFRSPYLVTECTMQIVDNLYSVSFFLYNLHIRTSSIKRARGIAERIRQVFYISVANFIFPLIFNIAQIVFATTDWSTTAGGMVLLINNYITVLGVLCATLWFSGSEWVRTRNEPSPEHMLNTPKPNLGRDRLGGEKSRSPVALIGKGFVPYGTTGLDPGTDPKQLLAWEKESGYTLV
ncbi:hypothetical protein EDD16DRAFT_1843568 [Pisolithus croceorrhizus]|nr:hypothetical protein EDD16DRAFT_1843568 [Pisolithus croceorrhizus]